MQHTFHTFHHDDTVLALLRSRKPRLPLPSGGLHFGPAFLGVRSSSREIYGEGRRGPDYPGMSFPKDKKSRARAKYAREAQHGKKTQSQDCASTYLIRLL
jgi:hypothetical protein